MTLLAFRDRQLTPVEFEKLRLTLSAFRDGSGQISRPDGSMPGFRDFERSLAAVTGGVTPEDKGIFDVHIHVDPPSFGISCKMSVMQPVNKHCSFMELSNSAKKFRNELNRLGINERTSPELAGPALVALVGVWHQEVGDVIDLASSKFAVLAHNGPWTEFQLLCFPISLTIANPRTDVVWRFEGASVNGYIETDNGTHRLWQCFLDSGGQLKYFPPLVWAEWTTHLFQLEEPPRGALFTKAEDYFPDLWPRDDE